MTKEPHASETDPEKLAEQLEREADALGQHSEELRSEVSDARDDWARKRSDEGVPGAPAPEGESHSDSDTDAAAARGDQPDGENEHGGDDDTD
jgi:hypothetical protein